MDLIVYHGGCPDGFCAAFVVTRRYPQAALVPMSHGQPPPDLAGKHVIVVDFSWSRAVVLDLHSRAASLRILDHHKTAEADLTGLDFATFDMERSGATLAWDWCFPGAPRPWWVSYVEDRDLWRWALPFSKAVSGYLMALPHTAEAWSDLDRITAATAAEKGAAIRLHIENYVAKVTEHPALGTLDGLSAAMVNAGYPNCSDVGHVLCDRADVGVVWFERADGLTQFSLRSIGDVDVSAVAKAYGGGGHKNAAGFQVPVREGRALVDRILGR